MDGHELTKQAQAIVRRAWIKTGMTQVDYSRNMGFAKNYLGYFLNHQLPQYRAILRLAEHITELAPLTKDAARLEMARFKKHGAQEKRRHSLGVFYPNPNAPELWKPPCILPPPVGF